jgi:hypothetical protein
MPPVCRPGRHDTPAQGGPFTPPLPAPGHGSACLARALCGRLDPTRTTAARSPPPSAASEGGETASDDRTHRRQTTAHEEKLGDLDVARIGLGAMGMSHAYTGAGSDDAESVRTIHRALDLGITLIDTA